MQPFHWAKALVVAALLAAASFTCSGVATAQQATPAPSPEASPASPDLFGNDFDGKLHVNITPYIWGPTLNGSFLFTGGFHKVPAGFEIIREAGVSAGPTDYLSKLNSAFMFAAEIRKGNSAILTDIIYTNLSSTAGSVEHLTGPLGDVTVPINTSVGSRLTSTIWGLALSPTFSRTEYSEFDGVIGFRYTALTAAADWTLTGPHGNFSHSGGVSEFGNTFAPIVGIRGKVGLGEGHWFIPFYADYGATGGLYTYQFIGGIAYGYHSGAALLVWRQLQYTGVEPTQLVQSLRLGGPTIAWTFRL